MGRKKVIAYIWSMRNGGLVQIGQTMYELATGNAWHVSHKPWLNREGNRPKNYKVTANSWAGA